eukprot:8454895-Pyramimonas_sp.AAC.1
MHPHVLLKPRHRSYSTSVSFQRPASSRSLRNQSSGASRQRTPTSSGENTTASTAWGRPAPPCGT